MDHVGRAVSVLEGLLSDCCLADRIMIQQLSVENDACQTSSSDTSAVAREQKVFLPSFTQETGSVNMFVQAVLYYLISCPRTTAPIPSLLEQF